MDHKIITVCIRNIKISYVAYIIFLYNCKQVVIKKENYFTAILKKTNSLRKYFNWKHPPPPLLTEYSVRP